MNENLRVVGYVLQSVEGHTSLKPFQNGDNYCIPAEYDIHPNSPAAMRLINHYLLLGTLMGQLHSLEFLIRIFLHKLPSAAPLGISHGTDIYTLSVGTQLPESPITDYRSLDELIAAFNAEVTRQPLGDEIDPAFVTIRNALAHGRVSYVSDDPNRIIKFTRPKKTTSGKIVEIEFNEVMNEEWFNRNIRAIGKAIMSVHAAMLKLETTSKQT